MIFNDFNWTIVLFLWRWIIGSKISYKLLSMLLNYVDRRFIVWIIFYGSEEKYSLILSKSFVRQSCSRYIFNLRSNSGHIQIDIHHHCRCLSLFEMKCWIQLLFSDSYSYWTNFFTFKNLHNIRFIDFS